MDMEDDVPYVTFPKSVDPPIAPSMDLLVSMPYFCNTPAKLRAARLDMISSGARRGWLDASTARTEDIILPEVEGVSAELDINRGCGRKGGSSTHKVRGLSMACVR
jgi:hypothetical protein